MREQVGPFNLEFLAVNHSIPDSLAVVIRSSAGSILATGDFKMDQLPLDGRVTDLRGFARIGEEGLDLFMVDSTNADVPGFYPARARDWAGYRVGNCEDPRQGCGGIFCLPCPPVQQVIDAAIANGRKVVFVGRSMVKNMGIASELGYLNVPADAVSSSTRVSGSRTISSSLCPRGRKASQWLCSRELLTATTESR